MKKENLWWATWDLNPEHVGYEPNALTIELMAQEFSRCKSTAGIYKVEVYNENYLFVS